MAGKTVRKTGEIPPHGSSPHARGRFLPEYENQRQRERDPRWFPSPVCQPPMRDLIRPMLPMIAVLLVPIIPFLLLGSWSDAAWEKWQQNPPSNAVVASVVTALLAADIFLPVPSSLVSTLAGAQLGGPLGIFVSWIGMTLGTILGFALAKKFGNRFALWFSRPEDLERANLLSQQYGQALLVIGRGVPVVAEASVLLLGMHGLSWRKFLPPVLLANLGLSVAYALFGKWTEDHGGLPVAIGFSIAMPVLMAGTLHIAGKLKSPRNEES